MHGHSHPLMVIVNAADYLGEVGLDVPERQHCHSQKRVASEFSCVPRGFKPCARFRFTGCCW